MSIHDAGDLGPNESYTVRSHHMRELNDLRRARERQRVEALELLAILARDLYSMPEHINAVARARALLDEVEG